MKAVLVMDMQKKCWLCPICLVGEEGAPAFGVCGVAGELIWNPDYKPDWCPLHPLPERKTKDRPIPLELIAWEMDTVSKVLDRGWNACLDAIEGIEGDD